jgi:hypothetical protein
VSISSLKNRLDALEQSMPPTASTEGAAERNARRLASIAATPEGAKRNIAIMCLVHAASGTETDEGYVAFVDSIGHEAIERAFPAGIPVQTAYADVRARARAFVPTGNERNPLKELIAEQVAKRDMEAALAAEEATS